MKDLVRVLVQHVWREGLFFAYILTLVWSLLLSAILILNQEKVVALVKGIRGH